MIDIPFANKIREMRKAFLRNTPDRKPSTLHIALLDEDDLFDFLPLLSATDAKRVHNGEGRRVFDRLYGLVVVYDADTTHVE